jgi:GNAT superfamily N-acetyltransferase
MISTTNGSVWMLSTPYSKEHPFYKATIDGELAAVIVYGPAHLALKARNLVLPMYKKDKNDDGREHAKKINNDIIRIWRVIVKPKFRGAGLASKLVRDTLMLTNYPYVETLAVMAQYSNFFESAGMVKVDTKLYNCIDKGYAKALDKLTSLGFDISMLISKKYCIERLEGLSNDKLEEVKDIIIKHFYSEKFKHPRALKDLIKGDIDALADALGNRKLPYVYLIWKNPNFKDKPDPKIFLGD